MRALIVSNMWPRADDPGFGVFVFDQVEALRGLGVDVTVITIDGRASKIRYAESIRRIRRAVSEARFDLVHAHYVLTGLATVLARAGRDWPPLLVTHHGVEVFDGWQAPLARWVSSRADDTLVMSREMAARLGVQAERVVPMGVDLELFRPGSRSEARTALGLPESIPVVAWIGADRPEKRLSLARSTIEVLRDTHPSATLHVVSGRPHDEIPTHLRAADCLLLTSRREGAPVVVKEALACDVPVVSTPVGDVPELLDGLAGCAVAEPTADALAAGLASALSHGPIQGRSVAERFATERMAARVLEVYGSLGAGR